MTAHHSPQKRTDQNYTERHASSNYTVQLDTLLYCSVLYLLEGKHDILCSSDLFCFSENRANAHTAVSLLLYDTNPHSMIQNRAEQNRRA